jgi:hypothetical protein
MNFLLSRVQLQVDSTSDRLVSGRDGFQRQQQYCTLGFPSCAVPEDGARVM